MFIFKDEVMNGDVGVFCETEKQFNALLKEQGVRGNLIKLDHGSPILILDRNKDMPYILSKNNINKTISFSEAIDLNKNQAFPFPVEFMTNSGIVKVVGVCRGRCHKQVISLNDTWYQVEVNPIPYKIQKTPMTREEILGFVSYNKKGLVVRSKTSGVWNQWCIFGNHYIQAKFLKNPELLEYKFIGQDGSDLCEPKFFYKEDLS